MYTLHSVKYVLPRFGEIQQFLGTNKSVNTSAQVLRTWHVYWKSQAAVGTVDSPLGQGEPPLCAGFNSPSCSPSFPWQPPSWVCQRAELLSRRPKSYWRRRPDRFCPSARLSSSIAASVIFSAKAKSAAVPRSSWLCRPATSTI